MHKYQKKKYILIKNIIKYINSDLKLKAIFNHKNRKYNINILLKYVIQILISGLSFRQINDFINKNIHWNTIYKFFIKLHKYNVIGLTYYDTVKKYITKKTKNKSYNIMLTDTTLILNKLGIDNVGYNPQMPKHKTTKISLITDVYGAPLNLNIYSGNINDSKILNDQFDDFINTNKQLLNNNNILLGDAGYDSNKLKDKIKNSKFGFLLTPKNKRNTKNKNKLNALKLSPEEKELMKKRIKVEHTNAQLKQYKRILFRYDKYSSHYLTFIHLACLDILIKMTKKK